ncbi:MAG: response regulator [Patescibacteria group bacterium]|nr:response regulator [Patescibacteria group bacterium]MDE2591032.1 response regulator [Patescibacteria group bacterium]
MDNHKKILVVDDDEVILEAFKFTLSDAGYDVTTITKDGKILQRNLKKVKPNLIILDVLLSGSDGRTIARNIRGTEKTKNIPIIMISAHPDAKDSTIAAGANEFLAKPFDIDDLLGLVKKYAY